MFDMRKISYMKRAAKRFLEGTACRHPVEAVELGLKTLEEWVEVLSQEREFDREAAPSRDAARASRKPSAVLVS
jgi:hypothetical protein